MGACACQVIIFEQAINIKAKLQDINFTFAMNFPLETSSLQESNFTIHQLVM